MTISLTQKKKVFIKQLCQEVLHKEFSIIRKIARLLVRFGPLHYRSLGRNKILEFKFAKGKFDRKMILWWIDNNGDSFSPIQTPNCRFSLKTDTSKSGWGAIFDKETTGGHFALDESLLHINVLELKAVLFGFKSLCSHLRQTHISVI